MTIPTFLRLLARYAGRYTWVCQGEALRGRLPQAAPWEWECPLTVVAKQGTARLRPYLNEPRAAVRLLGLSQLDGVRIQHAADYASRYPRLRQELFRLCGLAP